jgi:hypothetical protein
MKKIFLSIAFILASLFSFGQFTANLILSSNPPGTLMDWADKKEIFSLVIVNQSGAVGRFVIKAEFRLTDGTVIGSVDLARAKIFTLQSASLLLNAADVIPLNLVNFSGKYKTSLDKTGKLPAGTYMLCVQLVTPGSFQPVSEERCRTFTVAAFQLAVPIMPFDKQTLKAEAAQTAITFRWASVTPAPATPVTYRILVFEVLNNQTPMQALRSNQPLLNKEVIGTTQYIWQPQLGMIGCCPMDASSDSIAANAKMKNEAAGKKTFIWTLQCLDNLGRPISDGNINGDGISEPIIFYIGKEVDKLKEEIKKPN